MRIIRSLKYQEIYAQEKVTKVDSLSLVLSGKYVSSDSFSHRLVKSRILLEIGCSVSISHGWHKYW